MPGADPDVLALNTPVILQPGELLLLDGSQTTTSAVLLLKGRKLGYTQQVTLRRRSRGKVNGDRYEQVTLQSGGAGGVFYAYSWDVEDTLLLNGDGALVIEGSQGGGIDLQTIPDLGSGPFPLLVPLSAIAETEFSPGATETWELVGIHQPPSAALAGTISIFADAAETLLILQIALGVTDKEYLSAPIQVPPAGVIAVNVTAGGAAGTNLVVSGHRVA